MSFRDISSNSFTEKTHCEIKGLKINVNNDINTDNTCKLSFLFEGAYK